ncbi:hypothetical protein ACIBL3_22720 [Kribbella sp. NPDC050124]|uniref:hypothetical protein n=1 Tax=Kribbella sp. NPDC050124 TaxID=3364114 RepID=UPI00378EFDE1
MNILGVAALLLAAPDPTITMSQDDLTAVIGQTLTIESVVSGPAIAHLNVVSLDGVYVDLEDWSQDVTQPVPAEKTSLDWEFQAVNPGRFAVYVVLIPQSGRLVAGPPVHLTVSRRESLDTGGALPFAIAVPTAVAAAALAGHTRTARRLFGSI